MTLEEENVLLREENASLRRQLVALEEALTEAEGRLAALQEGRQKVPAFVKANKAKPTGERKPRRKRAQEHNHGRKRAVQVTERCEHRPERCARCGGKLMGKDQPAWQREVLEIPAPAAVQVTEHVVYKRWCGRCGSWQSAAVELRGEVVGHGRIGVRLASLIGYLRMSLRLTCARIREYLEILHGIRLSIGEVAEVLHRLAQVTQSTVESLKAHLRMSEQVHADETGWREDGQNGYVWSFSTSGVDGMRYYRYDRSRSHTVMEGVLGEEFHGVLSSDFYAAYNAYTGAHQRCWAHLLRDLHTLKEEHADQAEIVLWAEAVRSLYERGMQCAQGPSPPTQEGRERCYLALLADAHQLGLAYAQLKDHPCRALAKRLLRHEDELFQFVLREGLPADNNLAERSLRPVVVMRKISGGTRSPRGSQTRMALATLFGTWQARGLKRLL
jgi:hypothetical protein